MVNSAPGHCAGVFKQLSWTDRLLSVWIIGAMILGVILGEFTGASSQTQAGATSCACAVAVPLDISVS